MGYTTNLNWCRISEPSTVCKVISYNSTYRGYQPSYISVYKAIDRGPITPLRTSRGTSCKQNVFHRHALGFAKSLVQFTVGK